MKEKKSGRQKGLALVITLLILVIITLIGQFMLSISTTELKIAGNEYRTKQAFWTAEAAVNDGLAELRKRIDVDLNSHIQTSTPQIVINNMDGYTSSGNSILFLVQYAYATGETQFAQDGDTASITISNTPVNLGNYTGSYSGTIFVYKRGEPSQPSEDVYEFPFSYRIDGQGAVNPHGEVVSPHLINVELLGEFTITVQKDNFAKYALFTGQQTTPGGTTVWFVRFTEDGETILETKFTGPIHTNGHFNIYNDPTVTGPATQHELEPQFGHYGLDDADYYESGGTVYDCLRDESGVPLGENDPGEGAAGDEFIRSVDTISLPTATEADDQRRAALGLSEGESIPSYENGVYVPTQGSNIKGGVYIVGDSAVSMSTDASNNAVYSIAQGTTTTNVTVDFDNDQTTVETIPEVGTGSSDTYSGTLNGVIFDYNGSVTSLGGTIQQQSQVTIAASNDIVIQDHLCYEDYATIDGLPTAEGTTNVLGVVSWNGDVRIGTSAPDNIDIHSIIMAPNGIFTVDSYDDTGVGYRGQATLLGGIITEHYGAFGRFSTSSGPLSGYGRNFVYDQRMLSGFSSPYFPTLQNFIAISDLNEPPTWSGGGG